MKVSKYNFIIPFDEQSSLIYNTLSNAFIKIFNESLCYLENNNSDLLKLNNSVVQQLYKGRFLIEEDFDELAFLQYKYDSQKFNKDVMTLTIAPTLNCNFDCHYCFENKEIGQIDDVIEDKILQLISNNINKIKLLRINWFGGEPLLVKNRVMSITKSIDTICKNNNVKIQFSIITNGYNIDEVIAKFFKEYKFKNIQITLDGPREIHDKKRILINGKGTYDVIITNIKLLVKYNNQVSIRINTDKTNWHLINDVLLDLKTNNLLDVSPYLGHILPYNTNDKLIEETCYTKEDFAKIEIEFSKLLKHYGFKNFIRHPRQRGNYCSADQVNSLVINYDGELYKCYSDIGDKTLSCGNLNNNNNSYSQITNTLKYINWNHNLSSKCISCKILPLCMGGCPYWGIRLNGCSCDTWKYNLSESLLNLYHERIARKQL